MDVYGKEEEEIRELGRTMQGVEGWLMEEEDQRKAEKGEDTRHVSNIKLLSPKGLYTD